MYNVALLRIHVSLGVETADKVIGSIAQILECSRTHSGHDVHIQYNVDGVSQLHAYLCQRRTDGTHGVGNHIHGSALHYAVEQGGQLCIHFLGVTPVVGGACIFLVAGADEGSVLHTGYVVGQSSMIKASGELLLVETVHLVSVALGQCANLIGQCIQLLLGTVDPDYLIRLCQCNHFVNPLVDIRVLC